MVRTAALVLALASSAALAQPAPRAQYKTSVLGMTLQEWRALSFPGMIKPGEFSTTICSDEKKWRVPSDPLPITDLEARVGVIECSYYTDTKMRIGLGSHTLTSRSHLSLGTEHTMFALDYAFYKGRLFRIRGQSQLGAIDDIVEGLTTRFGEPAKVIDGAVRNGVGNSFPRRDYVWELAHDSILARAPGNQLDQSIVVFLDNAADDDLKAELERVNPSASKM